MKQPEPIDIEIPMKIVGGKSAAMYSMMPINALMQLRDFLDALIKWKALGNPVQIMSLAYIVRTRAVNENNSGKDDDMQNIL